MARKYTAIPIKVMDGVLGVAMANPSDIFALEALATQSQMRIEAEQASADEILEAIDFNYQSYDEIEEQVSNIYLPSEVAQDGAKFDTVTDAPVARALSLIIDEAVKAGASDVHLQSDEDNLRVRYDIE
jgi:general secretion pathway protein E